MMLYPMCKTCQYANREPTICEGCDNGSEYEDREEYEIVRRAAKKIVFVMKTDKEER